MTELDRPLAAVSEPSSLIFRGRFGFFKKIGVVFFGLSFLAFIISRIDFARDMHRLDTSMLSGTREGSYNAIVADLSERVAAKKGTLRNIETAGSTENVNRLISSAPSSSSSSSSPGSGSKCDVGFGLVQDGADFWNGQGAASASPASSSFSKDANRKPQKSPLELLGRLPKAESVFFLGRDVEKRTSLATLAGARIGIGPEGSGTERLGKQIFALDDLAGLGVTLTKHSVADQLAMAERGDLDLVMLVIDEDAPILLNAVRERHLSLANLSNLDVVARRIPRLRTGRIGAGQFDAVKMLPPEDRRVLRVDTLVIANGCAGRSATIDLLTVLSERFPEFVRHNKETPNSTGLELSSSSKSFFERGGPELADEYVPWLVDVMPPANWAYVIMGVSVLFNAMGAAHRFRLWRIDDARVKLEAELAKLFGPGATLGDIQRTKVTGKLSDRTTVEMIDALIHRFELLGSRSRRQSLSVLVPMGQEMAYRYQEGVIYQTLAVLRAFKTRWEVSTGAPRATATPDASRAPAPPPSSSST